VDANALQGDCRHELELHRPFFRVSAALLPRMLAQYENLHTKVLNAPPEDNPPGQRLWFSGSGGRP
jgi:hypothetical protein